MKELKYFKNFNDYSEFNIQSNEVDLSETLISQIDHSAGTRNQMSKTIDPQSMKDVVYPRIMRDIEFKTKKRRRKKTYKQKLDYFKKVLKNK